MVIFTLVIYSLGVHEFFLFHSFHVNDQDDVCSNWILLYFLDIVMPLLIMLGVAGMILRKNGKDLYREIWFPRLPRKQDFVCNRPQRYDVNE